MRGEVQSCQSFRVGRCSNTSQTEAQCHLVIYKVPEGLQASGKGLSCHAEGAGGTGGKHKLIVLSGPPTPVFLWSAHYFELLNKLKGEGRGGVSEKDLHCLPTTAHRGDPDMIPSGCTKRGPSSWPLHSNWHREVPCASTHRDSSIVVQANQFPLSAPTPAGHTPSRAEDTHELGPHTSWRPG